MDLKKRIVVIEDEAQIAALIKESLPVEDFFVEDFNNAADGIDAIKTKTPDALILDWELPDIAGPKVIRIIRQDKKSAVLPVIMLTVRKNTADITTALDLGADEYITKPFKPKELLARVNAVLRRIEMNENNSNVIKKGNLQLNIEQRKAYMKGKHIVLTEKEYQLLHLLLKRKERVVQSDEIIERIWGYEYMEGDIIGSKIRVLVQRLKSKIGKQLADKIVSKYGCGYQFED